MRVLWLSPWLRPLARQYCTELRSAGDEVLLVTSDQHPQPMTRLDWELVLRPHPKTANTWPEFVAAYRQVRRFRPDVVVTELVRDPRWLAFGTLAPRVQFIHDDRAHGPEEAVPNWERRLFDRWGRSAARTVCFSHYVARQLASRPGAGPIRVVPLTSDLPDSMVSSPATAAERRDFVLIGRLNVYKNLPVVFAAWQQHVNGPAYRGDILRLFGAAPTPPDVPEAAWWNGGSYDYNEVLQALSTAKGSIAHYRLATQSGVQVLSLQLGVAPIVSTEGGLPEFQPGRPAPVGVDDIDALTRVFDELADNERSAVCGAAAADHYRTTFAAPVATSRLRTILAEATASASNVTTPAELPSTATDR